ncbi:MAG: hypothetical protein ACFFG0_32370 [Candidatus Thorarchaeota archaeon]
MKSSCMFVTTRFPGIFIFVPIVLILFLATAGFISALLFGQAF